MARKPRDAPATVEELMLRAATAAGASYADVIALKALAAGEANSDQQKRAIDWIVDKACRRYRWAYEESARETDINLGRQRVGITITDMVNMPPALMEKLRKEP